MSINKVSHMNTTDKIRTTSTTASGVPTMLTVFGRRNHIKIKNNGSVDIAIGDSTLAVSGTNGYIIDANGGTWEDNTDAPIYIVSTGADSVVSVYERAER